MSESNDNETPTARVVKGQRQKRGSEKLIRLIDLIPKGNIGGGGFSKPNSGTFPSSGASGRTDTG